MEPKQDDDKPVAYDRQGQPLYLHPSQKLVQRSDNPEEMQVVQVTRSVDPVAIAVSPEMAKRHVVSKQKYPHLNLSAGEFVILDIRRHPIGLVSIWASAGLLALLIIIAAVFLLAPRGSSTFFTGTSSLAVIGFGVSLLILVAIFSYIAASVYKKNNFILTSESVIQRIQTSLFSTQEKTVNLENIKDARFSQSGMLQSIVGYGTIFLTTEGDNENYAFNYVAQPKRQIAVINNVVEAVKYGRPVEEAVESVVT